MRGQLNEPIPESLLTSFSHFVAEKLGLNFPPERIRDLERGARATSQEFGAANPSQCIESLMSGSMSESQIEILAANLTIGETYFFREPGVFEALEQTILPGLLQGRDDKEKRLRVWSAGCCTGEEAYSLAISLKRALPDLTSWKVTLLGSDINKRFLNKAGNGTYGSWSFRNEPTGLRDRYFKRVPNSGWEVLPAIKAMVQWKQINLAQDVYPSLINDTNAMDVILCRNVLIYFTPDQLRKVVQNLCRCLTEGGWLIVSPSEVAHIDHPQLSRVTLGGTTFFRKGAHRLAPADSIPIAAPSAPASNTPKPVVASEPKEKKADTKQKVYEESHALYDQGLYGEAALVLREETDAEALLLSARIMANKGDLHAALERCDKAIEVDRLRSIGHFLRAGILQEMGETEGAIASVTRAIYVDPEFVLAHFALGTYFRNAGKFNEAARHFRNVLQLLTKLPPELVVPESEGLTAQRLSEITRALLEAGVAA